MLWLHCYDTAFGPCGIAWSEKGVCGSQLPEASPALTRDRLRQRFPNGHETQVLPPAIVAAVQAVQRLLAGETTDHEELLLVQLDDSAVPDFHRQVLALTRQIPVGQTLTYGEIAARLGQTGVARAVGQAEGQNPFAPIVPCHRVLAAGAGQGGFSAHGGLASKQRLLLIEARARGQWAAEQSLLFEP